MTSASTENYHQLAKRFAEDLWDKHDLSVADEILSEQFIDYDPVPGQKPGRSGYIEMIRDFRSAFPDLRIRSEDVIVEGNKVVIRWKAKGTHEGPFIDIPPTGRAVELRGIDILGVENGRIIEHWGEFDVFGMLSQLGVIAQDENGY